MSSRPRLLCSLLPFALFLACGNSSRRFEQPHIQFELPQGKELVITHSSNRYMTIDGESKADKTTLVLSSTIVSGGQLGRDTIRLAAKITRVIVEPRASFRDKAVRWDSDDGPAPNIDEILITSQLLGLSYDIEIGPDRAVAISNLKWPPRPALGEDDLSVSQLMSDAAIASSVEKELATLPLGTHAKDSTWRQGSIDWELRSVAGGRAHLRSTQAAAKGSPAFHGDLQYDVEGRRPISYELRADLEIESAQSEITAVIEELTYYTVR